MRTFDMNVGMLWYIDSGGRKPMAANIREAAGYYQKKYQQTPNLCLVHPGAMEEGLEVEGLTIRPYRSILPNHLWIGVENEGDGLEK